MTRTPRASALLLALIAARSTAYAHQLDEYIQATLVEVEPAAIRLQINLTPGVQIADKLLGLIDRDGDRVISKTEALAYAEMLKQDLAVRLDGHDAELVVTGSIVPELSELRTGCGIIQMGFSVAPSALNAGAHTLAFENRHLRAFSVYLFNAAYPQSDSIQIIEQNRNDNQSMGEIEFAYQPPANAPKSRIVALLAAFGIAAAAAVLRMARSLRSTT